MTSTVALASLPDTMRQICALRRLKLFEGADVDAVLLRESHRRRGRLTIRLERGRGPEAP